MLRLALGALAAALIAGCSGSNAPSGARPAATFAMVTFTPTPSPSPSPTPSPTRTPPPPPPPTQPPVATAPPTATAAADIHATDWPRVVAGLLRADGAVAGGSVDPASVQYADLTGDGVDEAIVPVTANGSAGTIGYYVFGMHGGQPVPLLTRRGPDITVTVAGGRLVDTVADYAQGDPLCCPSQLRRTMFAWNGTALVQAGTEVVPNPNANG